MQDVLAGVRVVEVAAWTFVPISGAVLAEWGADVVKIEHPVSGDPQRGLVTSGLVPGGSDVNFMFEIPNRGKRSVGLDLSTDDGRELLYRLVETADVFVTNYLPDVRARLRIDVDDIRARNPNVIYVRGSGQGSRGPEAGRGGFDGASFWARGGLAMTFKDPAAEWPVDQRPGFGDVIGGLTIAGGIAAALAAGERTGTPSVVDVSLLGLGLWSIAPEVTSAKLYENVELPTFDRDSIPNPLVGTYPTKDGRFVALVLLQADRYWPDLCAHLERPDLLDDPRFKDAAARYENRRECIQVLRDVFRTRTYAEWRERLQTLEGVWAPLQTALEVHDDPQVIANGYLEPITAASGAEFALPANPVQFDETAPVVRRAPDHGEHTDEVLLELGLSYDEIIEHKIEWSGVVSESELENADFFRDDVLVADPYPYFDELRARCPVTWEPHHGVAMVTGYDEAVAVYHDVETFSSCNSVSGPFPGFPVPIDLDDVGAFIEAHRDELPMNDQLPTLDPPMHTAHRALLMRLITPGRLKENEEFMWRLADRQIDEFHANGSCEFVREYAGPFAMLVIADLLGVPEDDHDVFRAALGGRGNRQAIGSTEHAMALNPLEFLYQQFTAYIEDRRRAPRDDVLTGLATATFPDGSTPDVIDAARVASNLFAAGQETTVRLLASALQLVGERPELQQRLRDERDRIPNFVEETLRFESPVKGDFRLSRVPTSVGGVDIPAGTTVMVLNGAANRDPRRFENPAEFVADRPNARQHLAFGFGIHTCPGAPLARAEALVSLDRLFDRTTDIRISESEHGPAGARRYEYLPTHILRGLHALHLDFMPVDEGHHVPRSSR